MLDAPFIADVLSRDALPPWAPWAIVLGILGALVLAVFALIWYRKPKKFVYRGGIPDALGRRFVLYETDVPAATKIEAAEQYLRAGRVEDALEFYGYAGDRPGLEKMKAEALKSGSAYMLGRIFEFRQDLVAESDWEALEKTARALGRDADAALAYARVHADDEPVAEASVAEGNPAESAEKPSDDKKSPQG
jgi:hypothetical protein